MTSIFSTVAYNYVSGCARWPVPFRSICFYDILSQGAGHLAGSSEKVPSNVRIHIILHIIKGSSGHLLSTLRKHAYSNKFSILPKKKKKKKKKKNENFQMKNSGIFYISVQNINCRYLLEPPLPFGSKEYPQSIFLSRNNNINICFTV